MSNLEADPDEQVCPVAARGSVTRLLPEREVPLGGLRSMTVRRTLPHREVPTVGAWCFLDSFGPAPDPMRVLPHPHTGLQTVTWPFSGRIRHRDSLGSDAVVRAGELNLMTGGAGVSHSEFSVDSGDGEAALRGLQLWIALPDEALGAAAAFEQLSDLPVAHTPALDATVFVGEFGGQQSPAKVHTPLVGVDIGLRSGQQERLVLDPAFEHAVLLIDGDVTVDDQPLPAGPLLYLGPGRVSTDVRTAAGARLVLIGGAPFEHDLVMWWNFVGRSHEDIVTAREDWESHHERFGTVDGHGGERIPAPALPNVRLRARRRSAGAAE